MINAKIINIKLLNIIIYYCIFTLPIIVLASKT